MRREAIQPSDFGPVARAISGFFFSMLWTGGLASAAMLLAWGGDMGLILAVFFGCIIPAFVVAPIVAALVVFFEFWDAMARGMGTASLLCLGAQLRAGEQYPGPALLGGLVGVALGVIWCLIRSPRYADPNPSVCVACRYDLTGLPKGSPCPECGTLTIQRSTPTGGRAS